MKRTTSSLWVTQFLAVWVTLSPCSLVIRRAACRQGQASGDTGRSGNGGAVTGCAQGIPGNAGSVARVLHRRRRHGAGTLGRGRIGSVSPHQQVSFPARVGGAAADFAG